MNKKRISKKPKSNRNHFCTRITTEKHHHVSNTIYSVIALNISRATMCAWFGVSSFQNTFFVFFVLHFWEKMLFIVMCTIHKSISVHSEVHFSGNYNSKLCWIGEASEQRTYIQPYKLKEKMKKFLLEQFFVFFFSTMFAFHLTTATMLRAKNLPSKEVFQRSTASNTTPQNHLSFSFLL